MKKGMGLRSQGKEQGSLGTNLILGIVVRGDRSGPLPRISPFLVSLKKTRYDGDVVFLHPRGDSLTSWAIGSLGATPVAYSEKFPHLGPTQDEEILALEDLVAKVDFKRFSIVYQRHVVYLSYLVANREKYQKSLVLICDTLDVVFQAEPFRGMSDALYFFLDDDVSPDEPRFRKWASKNFDEDTLERLELLLVLRENLQVNAGVILGGYDKILDYLRAMINLIGRLDPSRSYRHGDQVLFNHVCYRSNLEGCCLVENGQHVANVSRVQPGTLSHRKGGGISYHGHPPAPIVHMYNRTPDLNRAVLKKHSVGSAVIESCRTGGDPTNLLLLWTYDSVAGFYIWLKKLRAKVGKLARKLVSAVSGYQQKP